MNKTLQTSTIVIIGGFGKIGTEVRNCLQSMGCKRILTGTRHNDLYTLIEANVDLVFLAIPTEDDGEAARNYLLSFLKEGIPVVTCEKGALANHCAELQPYLDSIGYSATVGGGSDLIHALQRRLTRRPQTIHVILNGTINSIWNRLAQGATMEQAVCEARALGLVEPGDAHAIGTIQREFHKDIPCKTAILFNLLFRGPQDEPKQARVFEIRGEPGWIQEQTRLALSQRFVVSFYAHSSGYRVNTEFRNVQDHHIRRLCEATLGACNGFLTVERENGTCLHVGEGAGPGPTAAAMIQDAERLLAARNR